MAKELTAVESVLVTEENTARTMGSGSLNVFATPAMIALMEKTSCKCIENELEEGETTVGTRLEIDHVAASPVGIKVTCKSTLVERDGRKFVFEVEASDEKGLIGKGKHERFLVNAEKFQNKADSKMA